MSATSTHQSEEISTLIPARLERLPWGRFHVLVIVALGITWILDGLEVTLAGSVAPALKESPALHFSDSEVGLAGSAYLLGAVVGALFFGWLTDRLGRKMLFFITIVVYLIATALTGLAWNGFSFFVFRFFTGCGIGGEYSAINSTIQELVPARYRGQLDLTINGSFWVGAALGAVVAVVLLNPALIPAEWGWRLAFLTGAILGLVVFFMRMWVPESPRWLAIHGREKEGEDVVKGIEKRFEDEGVKLDPAPSDKAIRLRTRDHTPLSEVFDTLINRHRVQTFVGLTLMAAQAFFYNAIFFTYALVLTKFYSVGSGSVGWYILPFALSNFLGPVILGRLFDTLGRRIMITLTYGLSGVLHARGRPRLPAGSVVGDGPDDRLDDRVLHRLSGSERGLSHSQRDVPDRNSRDDDRNLLRHRNRRRRRRRAAHFRQADRERIAAGHLRRLCVRRLSHVRRRNHCLALRHQRRAQAARAGRRAAVGGGVEAQLTAIRTAPSPRP